MYAWNQLFEGERVNTSYTVVCSMLLSRCEAKAVISISRASRSVGKEEVRWVDTSV